MQNRNVCKILTTFLLLVLFLNIVGKALSEPYFCRIFVGTLDIVHDLNRTPTQYIQLERDKPWQYLIFLLKTMTLSENRVTNRDRPWHAFFLEPKVWKWPSWSYGRTLKVIENHGSPNVIKIWCRMTNRTVGRPHSLHPAKYANRPDDGSTGIDLHRYHRSNYIIKDTHFGGCWVPSRPCGGNHKKYMHCTFPCGDLFVNLSCSVSTFNVETNANTTCFVIFHPLVPPIYYWSYPHLTRTPIFNWLMITPW